MLRVIPKNDDEAYVVGATHVDEDECDFVCLVYDGSSLGHGHDVARLLAAAPELLAACEAIMQAEGMQRGERNGYIMGVISTAIDSARAAIAKAKGGHNG